MQYHWYQAIILAFRCPLASICRGPPGQSHWNQSELVKRRKTAECKAANAARRMAAATAEEEPEA